MSEDTRVPDPEQPANRSLATDVIVPIAAAAVSGVVGVGATVAAEKLLKRPGNDKDD
jgi:hypothetical protein